jgi:hypothetical protein
MVSLTPDELKELTPEECAEHFENERKAVFGHDYKKDKHGNPIPQGLGSPGNFTEQHWAALLRSEGAAAVSAMKHKYGVK